MTVAVGTGGKHDFAINGRFFSQPVTGVQRYAREVVRAVDRLLYRSGRVGTVLAPKGDDVIPPMQSLQVRRFGPAGGHVWEQTVLPTRWRGPLINLCNTAPVVQGDQIVCMHDANVYRMPESYGRGFRMLYQVLQPMLVRRSARIATVSHDSARQLAQHLPLKATDVAVLPNGHEHVLSWRPEAATVFDAGPQHRPFVLLLGSRAKHKNAALVLNLADVLDEMGLDLLVAGSRAGIFASIGRSRPRTSAGSAASRTTTSPCSCRRPSASPSHPSRKGSACPSSRPWRAGARSYPPIAPACRRFAATQP